MSTKRCNTVAMAMLMAVTGAVALADEPAATQSDLLSPQAATLSPPVTLTYSGSSNALTVTDSGTGRGISSTVTNTNSGSSALYGSTVGSGAGLTGFNGGTGGPAGKFEVTNAKSEQPGVYATSSGLGPAIQATLTNADSRSAAIIGINTTSQSATESSPGVGVKGEGSSVGVLGMGTGFGGAGVSGSNSSSKGSGVIGVDQASDGTGIGVYGGSDSGYAGYFQGNVLITLALTVNSINYSSDRRLKTDVTPIDGTDLLDRISRMPITSWDYKTDPNKRHIGPMAQDFHAAFGLNGTDESHISEVDIAGVSLAAIKELHKQLKQKDVEVQRSDVRIAELSARLDAQSKTMAAMEKAFSARMTALERQATSTIQTTALRISEK